MIEQFTKEEFMHQPMEVRIENTYVPLEADKNCGIIPQTLEQTIVLHVGGEDYDIRDLVWRLHEAEMRICELADRTTRLEQVAAGLESAAISVELDQCIRKIVDMECAFHRMADACRL